MESYQLNGLDYLILIENGTKSLSNDMDRINALNVFPVPDGDTGTNMTMTIEGGLKKGLEDRQESISEAAKSIARAMVLSARGNSGVILSQFFKGLSLGLEGKEVVSVREMAESFNMGTKKAYSVVQNPTEGTILTVMREAGSKAYAHINKNTTFPEYLELYLRYANEALDNTPELLPVLKKAGVIDSGGAGFVKIIEGMHKASLGEILTNDIATKSQSVTTGTFNADSELTYGYCTEFILQLQNSKVDVKNFDINIIQNYLETMGNSIVSFKDDDIIKVHVHTFDPGLVLNEMRKYGEFLTIKIENMNVQHSENEEIIPTIQEDVVEHKKYATVVVASGEGIAKAFKDMGVDRVVEGGQTMNTSTNDFIEAFDKLDAEYILVYPNNSNIKMAAQMAAETYTKAKVYVVPTRTISEGYSACSMLDFDCDDIDQIIDMQKEVISNVSTLEVTHSIRDAIINDIEIHTGDYICLYKDNLISADKDRLTAIKKAFDAIEDFEDKQVLTIIYGKDSSEEEFNAILEYAQTINSYVEAYPVEGDQEIYNYIIGIE